MFQYLFKIISKLKIPLMLLVGCMVSMLSGCSHTGGMLNAKGPIAVDERKLFFDAIALMLIVVIPVIIMSFAFAFRYRASHPKAEYSPDMSHNTFLECLWWGIPMILVIVLGIMAWKKSHSLDPYRSLDVPGKPVLVEAVALRWKWLFIYPKQGIATINYLTIPTNRPVQFYITSDAPMSSFFIPQLGSQIFAMAGMRTRLHVITSHPGVYEGMNTQFNGAGFSDMHFKTYAVSNQHYKLWLHHIKHSHYPTLNIKHYQKIVQPTIANKPAFYSHVRHGLFKRIMMQYMMPNMRLH